MKKRNVEKVFSPPHFHWVGDGFKVNNYIPGVLSMQRMNPFIMLDYNSPHHFEATNKPGGVGVHPHRGFETVTIAYKGKVAHHDSTGAGGVIGEGDVQWMTAASGVLHKEYHEREWAAKGGLFQMVQLWVNLPAKYKMSLPKYQAIENSKMGRFRLSESGYIEVIAGDYKGVKGPASTFSPVNLMNARLLAGESANFYFPENYNTFLIVLEGEIEVNENTRVAANQLSLMENEGEDFEIRAKSESVVLILSGEPLNEPIAAYGPFVMNTRAEIMQAYEDFNAGKFGYLKD